MERVGFVIACSKYFGRKGTLKEFNEELKALTPEDRAELAGLFPTVGYEITDITITPKEKAACEQGSLEEGQEVNLRPHDAPLQTG